MAVRSGTTRPYRPRYSPPETGRRHLSVADPGSVPAVQTQFTTESTHALKPREARSTSMEMEYKDNNRRGKFVIIAGVVLAIVAGATSFFLINQAQQKGSEGPGEMVTVVVAAQIIPARTPVAETAVTTREIPLDPLTQVGIVTDPKQVIGKVFAIPVAVGQPLYLNMIASSAGQSGFEILGPDETVAPDSEAWRAISITIPDDRAVAGLLVAGQTIDIFMSATMSVPVVTEPVGVYYSEMATKITYQDMVILGRAGSQYILKTSLAVAEEI